MAPMRIHASLVLSEYTTNFGKQNLVQLCQLHFPGVTRFNTHTNTKLKAGQFADINRDVGQDKELVNILGCGRGKWIVQLLGHFTVRGGGSTAVTEYNINF